LSQTVYYVAYPRSVEAYNDARNPTWLEQKDIQHLPKILSHNGYYVAYPKSAQEYGEARTPTWVHQKRYSNTLGNSVTLFLVYSIIGLSVYSLYFLT